MTRTHLRHAEKHWYADFLVAENNAVLDVANTMGPTHSPESVPVPRIAEVTGLTEMDALRQENKELRELVIQLSKLVVKNVLDRT